MEWVNLNASALTRAAAESGLALLPLGSIEAHGSHLPLGNDTFKVHRACIEASRLEPAVTLPPFFYTEVQSLAAAPGAIGVPGRVLADLAESICDEVARNGFTKIMLVSGHGGNRLWTTAFLTELMAKSKPYTVYFWYMKLLGREENRKLMETAFDGHGGEVETSIALHLTPDLCRLAEATAAVAPACDPDLGGAETAYDWVARWPQAVSGDPGPASADKGRIFFDSCIEALAEAIRKVKADTVIPAFQKRFDEARREPAWPTLIAPARSGRGP